MKTYIIENAIVNVHGDVDQEKIRAATITFLKKAEKCRKKKENSQNGNCN
jgi:hypothetical protein